MFPKLLKSLNFDCNIRYSLYLQRFYDNLWNLINLIIRDENLFGHDRVTFWIIQMSLFVCQITTEVTNWLFFITLYPCLPVLFVLVKALNEVNYWSRKNTAINSETHRICELISVQPRSLLIVLGVNDTSTLVGHFVLSPREREKREEIAEEMKERDREERRTGMKVKKQKK